MKPKLNDSKFGMSILTGRDSAKVALSLDSQGQLLKISILLIARLIGNALVNLLSNLIAIKFHQAVQILAICLEQHYLSSFFLPLMIHLIFFFLLLVLFVFITLFPIEFGMMMMSKLKNLYYTLILLLSPSFAFIIQQPFSFLHLN